MKTKLITKKKQISKEEYENLMRRSASELASRDIENAGKYSDDMSDVYYGNSRRESTTGEAGNLGTITVTGSKAAKRKPYFVASRTGQLTAGDAAKAWDTMVTPALSWATPNFFRAVDSAQKGDIDGVAVEGLKALGLKWAGAAAANTTRTGLTSGFNTFRLMITNPAATVNTARTAVTNATKNIFTPGSSFWAHPFTKKMTKGVLAGEGANTALKLTTGKNWGENLSDAIYQTTGWNPRSSVTGTIATDVSNPFYYSPSSLLTPITEGAKRLGKGLDYLVRMDMPRYGYAPTTKYYFKPGTIGINGVPIGTSEVSVPITRLISNLRGTFSPQDITGVIGRLTRNDPNLRIDMIDSPNGNVIPILRGPRLTLLDLQNDLNNKLSSRGVSRLNMVSLPLEITLLQRGPIIDERIMNSSAPMGRTRTVDEVKKYGRYKIEDILDLYGRLRFDPFGFDGVLTGAHGDFIFEHTTPTSVSKKLIKLYNSSAGKRELNNIMASNPTGRSGILIHTHDGDLSVDSHPLALALERRLGELYIPISIPNNSLFVSANNLGYKNLFLKPNKWQISDELNEVIKSGISDIGGERFWLPTNFDNKGFVALKDTDGSLIIKDASGKTHGYIPALTPEETLEVGFNGPIRELNKKFGINIRPAFIDNSRHPFAPLWTFQKGIMYPNLTAIELKKGGNIVLKFKNRNNK